MRIQIFGQEELISYIKNGGLVYSHCISITNPGFALSPNDTSHRTPAIISSQFQRVLRLKFWDVSTRDSLHGFKVKRLAEYGDAVKVIDFIKTTEKESTGYTVHCWQGISRSPAVALGILQYFNHDADIASHELVRIRYNAMPLQLLVQHFDTLLGSNLSEYNRNIHRERLNTLRREMLGDNATND
jgi:predicted protein tyrosine phosphatase